MDSPKIRFKGYTDAWEQRKLGEMLSLLKDGTHGTHADVADGPLLLSAKNIKNGTIIWDESDRRISQEEYEKIHSKFCLKDGDILLTIVGSIGETAILKGAKNITFQRSVAFLRPNKNITSEFLYTKIQTPTFQKDLESRKSTSAQPGIYLGDLAEIPVKYSSSIEEQIKIGEYFLKIDHLITLHQRKCEQTKKFKKFMLQKMFPQDGANVPEIRFSGFTDAWEQRKLSDISDVRDGTHASPKYFDKGHPFVTSKNVKNGFINYEDIQFISDEDFDEINKRSKVDVNDILMGMIGTIGNIALIRIEPDFAIKNVALIKDTKQVNHLYLYHFLQSDKATKQLAASMDGGTQKFIALGNVRNLEIDFPSNEEQAKLGGYFERLDHLITLHQRKYEELQKIKKFMLQNLFV